MAGLRIGVLALVLALVVAAMSAPVSATSPVYESCSVSGRARRTKAQIEAVKTAIADVVARERPMTARQVFYQLTVAGIVPKTERGYRTVVRLLTQMRRDEEIAYEDIADSTRWMLKPESYIGLHEMMRRAHEFYRRDLWCNQDVYVEVWCEKNALAGVISVETKEYDVPLFITKGYSSLSFLYESAQFLEQACGSEKTAHIYYIGDHDPSGLDIERHVEEGIREFAMDVDIEFERLAVTPAQIKAFDLPTRPTKQSDTRSRHFRGASVEVDAIPPKQLRRIVREAIKQHIDAGQVVALERIEQMEKHVLEELADRLEDGGRGLPKFLKPPITRS